MNRLEKSTWPRTSPIGGMMTSLVSDDTIFPNAAPTTNPTARSITFPFIANCLNSESIDMAPVLRCWVGVARNPAYQSIAARQCKTPVNPFSRRPIDFAETHLIADQIDAQRQEVRRWDLSISRMKHGSVQKLK